MKYYKEKLPVVKFITYYGEKRVILQRPDNGTITVPVSWTDLLKTNNSYYSNAQWADCQQLLVLAELVSIFIARNYGSNGDLIGTDERQNRPKAKTDNTVRNPGTESLANIDTRATQGNRGDLRSDSVGSNQVGGGLQ